MLSRGKSIMKFYENLKYDVTENKPVWKTKHPENTKSINVLELVHETCTDASFAETKAECCTNETAHENLNTILMECSTVMNSIISKIEKGIVSESKVVKLKNLITENYIATKSEKEEKISHASVEHSSAFMLNFSCCNVAKNESSSLVNNLISSSEHTKQNELYKQEEIMLEFDNNASSLKEKGFIDRDRNKVSSNSASKEELVIPASNNHVTKIDVQEHIRFSVQNINMMHSEPRKAVGISKNFTKKVQVSKQNHTVLKHDEPNTKDQNEDFEIRKKKLTPVSNTILLNCSNLQENEEIIKCSSTENELLVNKISLKPNISVKVHTRDHTRKFVTGQMKFPTIVQNDKFLEEKSRNDKNISYALFSEKLNKNFVANKKTEYDLNSTDNIKTINKGDNLKVTPSKINNLSNSKTHIGMYNIVVKINLLDHTRKIALNHKMLEQNTLCLQRKTIKDSGDKPEMLDKKSFIPVKNESNIVRGRNFESGKKLDLICNGSIENIREIEMSNTGKRGHFHNKIESSAKLNNVLNEDDLAIFQNNPSSTKYAEMHKRRYVNSLSENMVPSSNLFFERENIKIKENKFMYENLNRKKIKAETVNPGECTLIFKKSGISGEQDKRKILKSSMCSVSKICNTSKGNMEQNIISKENKNVIEKHEEKMSIPDMTRATSTVTTRAVLEKISSAESIFVAENSNMQNEECLIFKNDKHSLPKTNDSAKASKGEHFRKNTINIKNENEVYKNSKSKNLAQNMTGKSTDSNTLREKRQSKNVVPRTDTFISTKLSKISAEQKEVRKDKCFVTGRGNVSIGSKEENLISKKHVSMKNENEVYKNSEKEKSVSSKCNSNTTVVEVPKETSENLFFKEGKITEFHEEKSDIEDPEWQKIKNLNTNEKRYKQVRACWQSKTVPNPNRNLTYQSFRNRRLKIRNYVSREIKQHKRQASNTWDDHKAKRICTPICTYHIDKKINIAEGELLTKEETLRNEMNCFIKELEQQRVQEEESVRNAFILNGYDQSNSYARIVQMYNIHLTFTQQISELQNRYQLQIEQSAAQYQSKINALNKVRDEIFQFYNFYKDLDDNGDPTFVTEYQLKELDEIENIYSQFQKHYK